MCDVHNEQNMETLRKMTEELAALIKENTMRFDRTPDGKRVIEVSVTKMENSAYVCAVDKETGQEVYAVTVSPEQANDVIAWMEEYRERMQEGND